MAKNTRALRWGDPASACCLLDVLPVGLTHARHDIFRAGAADCLYHGIPIVLLGTWLVEGKAEGSLRPRDVFDERILSVRVGVVAGVTSSTSNICLAGQQNGCSEATPGGLFTFAPTSTVEGDENGLFSCVR